MLVGCDDPVVDPLEVPTETEALALFTSLEKVFVPDLPRHVDAGPVDTTVRCPLGGNARVAGTRSNGAADLVVTATGCKVSGDGLTFTVNGGPMRIEVATYVPVMEVIRFEGGVAGRIKWQLGDRSGDCTIDMSLDAEVYFPIPEDPVGGYKGRMCGHATELGFPGIRDG